MGQHHDPAAFIEATRRDGWTPALKARFLSFLAETGNVRLSTRRCGLSAQSAYVQRRRDPVFARGWAGALMLARDHGEQVLADRALEGVEEPVFYRGEQVGTRRRYDNRLLLAHLARLDRLAGDEAAERDAGRFDELLALIAGEEPPEAIADAADVLPAAREAHAEAAAGAAERAAQRSLPRARGLSGKVERDEAVSAAGDKAYVAAECEWDVWFERACTVVDGLAEASPPGPDAELLPQDSVNPSTSPACPGPA